MGVELLTKPRPKRRRKLLQERITFEQFCDLIHENQKADLIPDIMFVSKPRQHIVQSAAVVQILNISLPST